MYAGGDVRTAGSGHQVGAAGSALGAGHPGPNQSAAVFLVSRFETEEEALAVANAANVGLAGEKVRFSSGPAEPELRQIRSQ